ncbi:MAG: right-handed parallel beta-helix repeat-containing protein [Oscillospiraceae bacterium]|nr:right-handed parallel beta-helix repeat-containing protein [Oscillospiraceae bacterium]
MKRIEGYRGILSTILVLTLLLSGFGAIPCLKARAEGDREVFSVSTVDELLAAIGPNREIRLEDGVYNLTTAADYGGEAQEYYRWNSMYMDGDAELSLFGLSNLSLIGSGSERCRIVTEPRYANVLQFRDCDRITLSGLTVGHTDGVGYCTGGVLDLNNCDEVTITACDLYGCGTLGISAQSCRGIIADRTTIRECSYGALEMISCYDVRFQDGVIRGCGINEDYGDGWTAFNLIYARMCTAFAVMNTEISANRVQTLFSSGGTASFLVSGCSLHDNLIGTRDDYFLENGTLDSYEVGGMYQVSGQQVTVIGTEMRNNRVQVPLFGTDKDSRWDPVADENGNTLDESALETMVRDVRPSEEYSVPEWTDSAPAAETADGQTEYHAATADEFLAAIGSNRTIYVDAEELNFDTASEYGGAGGNCYYWMDNYDGPGIVITGVDNLTIIGQGKDQTTLLATPRYSDVIYFENCSHVSIQSLTAGHVKEAPGSCAGDVFEFIFCRDCSIVDCGLFGCGVNGILADSCSDFRIADTEIFDCSQCGAMIYGSDHFSFAGCSMHDCAENGIWLSNTDHVYWDDMLLNNGFFGIQN